MSTPLTELALAHGIILDYYDIWGQRHHAADTALVAILGAMGVDAGNAPAIEAALHVVHRERWREVLPPAIVVNNDTRPWTVPLTLPASPAPVELQWSIGEEHGAQHAGTLRWEDLAGIDAATIDDQAYVKRAVPLDVALPHGYHRLRIAAAGTVLADVLIAVTPKRGYWPQALRDQGRVWGITAQLYGMRSERNWGIGDLTDLATLIDDWGARGAGVIGLNPLHALYPHNPEHASPYSPSSRLFRNWLYIDVTACADFRECAVARELVSSAAFQARLSALRATDMVDYPGVARAKREVLDLLYASFRARHVAIASERAAAFRIYQAQAGAALRSHALFEALQEHFSQDAAHIWGWPLWPKAYRDPRSRVVAQFAAEHIERVEFFAYLQWQFDIQYAGAAQRSLALGLSIGIYEDLAVSVDRGGAETWANQAVYADGAGAGAPPDDFNLQGQDWGLPPMIPRQLRDQAYAPFIATLRANMQRAGALRIDHVMGLMRLFWVPPGGKAIDGVYVRYPFEDLLGLLCLESERNQCLVIGEDLGTVPDEVRHALWHAGVLSYRLLYFERRHDGEFKAPHEYPEQAIVAATTHDLPTLSGWWAGRDIELRTELALFPNEAVREAQIAGRDTDRARLLGALLNAGKLRDGAAADPAQVPAMTAPIATAIHAYLAASPAKVMVAQLEDLLLAREQANLPGTIEEHPNWRRKLGLTLAAQRTDECAARLSDVLSRERPR